MNTTMMLALIKKANEKRQTTCSPIDILKLWIECKKSTWYDGICQYMLPFLKYDSIFIAFILECMRCVFQRCSRTESETAAAEI